MTFVFLQYPVILILLLVSAILILAAFFTIKHSFLSVMLPAILGALSVSGLILACFYYAIPLQELLLLTLLLLLLCSMLLFGKEEAS